MEGLEAPEFGAFSLFQIGGSAGARTFCAFFAHFSRTILGGAVCIIL
jgi:hypothetical protein